MLIKRKLRSLTNKIGLGGHLSACSLHYLVICVLACPLIAYLLFYYFIFIFPRSNLPVQGWEKNISRDLQMYIVPRNDTAVISNDLVCKKQHLLIVVCSNTENFQMRAAIRETWGQFPGSEYKLVFLLGIPLNSDLQEFIQTEADINGDIIQENFIDSYNNLTLKSAMLLKFVVNYCTNIDFILKTDDDVFVYVPNLLKTIKNKVKSMDTADILLGYLFSDVMPINNHNSKWYSPKYMYSGNYYPDYLSGSAYLMSQSVTKKLYGAALVTPIYYLEDVYITGICAKTASITPTHDEGFSYLSRPEDACIYVTDETIISSHRVSPQQMRQLWINLHGELNCTRLVQDV